MHVATPPDAASARIGAKGFVFHSVQMSRSGARPWSELRTFFAIVRLLRSVSPDILHTVAIKPVLYGGIAARILGRSAVVSAIPGLGSVFTESGPVAAVVRVFMKWVYARALRHENAKVIFQNAEDRKTFLDAAIVQANDSVLIRGSGVDLSLFRSSPLPSGTPIVMFASRMLWAKGVREFVGAARRLRSEGLSARFVLVGEPDTGNPWYVPHEALQAWHRSGVIEWWGRREDMPQVISQAYLFCLPSYYGEGLPKALLEAASCARPLIGSDIPGCREIIRHDVNGLLVPVRDEEALAQSIRCLIDDRARAEKMAQKSREAAEAEFGVEHVVRQTLNVYADLLRDRAPSTR